MSSITARQLKAMLDNNEPFQLVDVREPGEHNSYNIGGTLIPLDAVLSRSSIIRHDIPVIFYCQKGIRSLIAIQRLQAKAHYPNLVNLKGGMQAWQREFS